jgi:uncharacterized protein (TIGR02687 family)
MSIQSIEQSLKQRFAAPLPDFYKRRIIFWHDPDGEFAEMIDELHIDNAKVLKLTGTNNFYAKMLLSETDLDSNYLVYNPISYADIRDNWLLDIECYSEEFRADILSIRMSELGMSSTHQLRAAMKGYSKFFDNKERVAKLALYNSNYESPRQLHIDVMAVLCNTQNNSVHGVIRALLMAGTNDAENRALENIRKFGNEEVFWNLIERYTGFVRAEGATLATLAAHILMTALSQNASIGMKQGLEKLISEAHAAHCYALINEWMYSNDDDALYEIAREVEDSFSLADKFDKCDVSELVLCESFPCINECILRHFMNEITDRVIKIDSIIETVEKRRTLKWYKRVRHYYDGILQVAKMQKFYQDHAAGFHIAEHEKMWEAYVTDYCKMDTYYRLFHTSFGKSLRESSTVLEDHYKGVADYVEGLYKNWYLAELGSQWTTLICDEVSENVALSGITQQSDFYKSLVAPIVASGSRVYVIISDALRYEVGAQLSEELVRDTKGSSKITAIQATFPSATKYGMAALLPHTELKLTADMRVLCDGLSTDGTAAREHILKKEHIGNVAISYKEIRDMKKADRRELVSGAQVVYIYHNTIDALGDKAVTEGQVFNGCEEAISEIKNLVRVLVNDLSATNIIIAADHGFLYSYKPLEESEKASQSLADGNIYELDRRYMISDANADSEYLLKLPLDIWNTDLIGLAPKASIRMKKQGGGANYVHGGITLQECVVPVIEFKNVRTNSKEFVQTRKATVQLLSQSRKISNSIFSLDFYQPEAVEGKVISAAYEVYISDAMGQPVSDRQKVIADKMGENGADRVMRARFTLKSMEFKKTESYFLTIVDSSTGGVLDKVQFNIDIAFINDFDF